MTDKDFKNLEDIQRILKYLDKGKLDATLWPNALGLKESLDKLLDEHKEYTAHMQDHH
ncbi:hypothetical protein OAP76_06565 [Alphaproteobacteria bacterium]|nr:hypothetical protein [Alphaproteobacteria bacterium]